MRILDKSLLFVANRMMNGIGHLEDLHINTHDRSATTSVMLAGEANPIEVNIGHFEFLKRPDNQIVLQLRDVSCSKEWMDHLADKMDSQMNIDLPPSLSALLRVARLV